MKNKADVNFVNEHGNTALHYACFWNYPAIAEDLVEFGALVNVQNKYGETPLDKKLLLAELSTPGSEDFMGSPEDAVGVIERMVKQDPAQRYQSIDEIIEDLAILKDE